MTKTLNRLRAEIDAVDTELVAALAKRTNLVAEVAGAKAPGSAIFRPGREADLQVSLLRRSPNESQKLIAPVWRPLLRASIASQKPDFTVAYLPDAQTAAEIFSAGFLTLTSIDTAQDGLDRLKAATADICFMSYDAVLSLGDQLGPETGIYVVSKEDDWYLLAAGLPDPSERDVTIFAHKADRKKDDGHIEFTERSGYFETVSEDMPDAHIIGIYQILKP